MWGRLLSELAKKKRSLYGALEHGRPEFKGEGKLKIHLPRGAAVTASNLGAEEIVAEIAKDMLNRSLEVELVPREDAPERLGGREPAAGDLEGVAERAAEVLGGKVVRKER